MENNTQSKAVIYCRVSTKEQVEEGNSLATQERNCREYAKKYEYEITQVFIEEGESAKTADRTELQKLWRFCSDKKQAIKAVIIYKIDRLSRNTDDYSQLRLLLKRYGVEIKSTSEYFENTPAGRFMENIIANVAQFDNDVRTERSVGGMRDAVREGRYVWVAPVGYKNQKVEGKASIIQTEKARLVRMAFEMMAEKKYSVNAIYESLLSQGLTSRFSKPISKSAFYSMLKNELYTGNIYKFGERHRGKFEPIISEELYNRVQLVMRNKKPSLIYKLENPDFPLRRFVCHPSKIKLTGAWSKGRVKSYAYYRYPGTKLYWPKVQLETLFYSFMDEYALDQRLLSHLKKEMSIRFNTKLRSKTEYIKAISSKKQQLKTKQNALIQKNIKGVISDFLLKEQLSALEEEIWDIDKALLQKEEKQVNVTSILEYISEFLLYPSLTWRNMPLKTKIYLQWFQFPEGVVFDGNEFRTTKISSLFKLKQFFLPQMSCNVHYSRLNNEHNKSSTSSAPMNKGPAVWKDVEEELRSIEAFIKTKDETTDQEESPLAPFFSSSAP
jgi:DNA invertase Pin-like site-specific DNA recombinase